MLKTISANNGKVGVFLCRCGEKIDPKIDLNSLEQILQKNGAPHWVETLPFPCMAPGLRSVKAAVADHDQLVFAVVALDRHIRRANHGFRDTGNGARRFVRLHLNHGVKRVGAYIERAVFGDSEVVAAHAAVVNVDGARRAVVVNRDCQYLGFVGDRDK